MEADFKITVEVASDAVDEITEADLKMVGPLSDADCDVGVVFAVFVVAVVVVFFVEAFFDNCLGIGGGVEHCADDDTLAGAVISTEPVRRMLF